MTNRQQKACQATISQYFIVTHAVVADRADVSLSESGQSHEFDKVAALLGFAVIFCARTLGP
jgi:hypothetical protein